MRSVGPSLLAIALLAPATARADEAPVTIQVTGSAASGFASKADEEHRPRDVADTAALLDGLPGVRVRRLGSESSFATVSIRGAASNQVAITFAGVPLTGAADPSLDLATLPLWPSASVRVYRTFAPAQLGGGYLGGLIEVQPLDLAGRARTEIYDAVGSFGSLRLRVADVRPLGASDTSWKLATGLSASRSEGDFPYLDPLSQTDVRRRNAGNAQVAGVLQARRDVDAWTILLTALASTRRDGVAGSFEQPTTFTRMFRDRELAAIEARRHDDAGRSLMRVWVRREGREVDVPEGERGLFPGASYDRVVAVGATLGRSLLLGPVLLDARVEEASESSSGSHVRGDARRDRLRLGLALDATLRANETLRLVAAARADARNDVSAETTDREVLPAVHVGFEQALGKLAALAGHVGLLSRPPSFLELLGDGDVYVASPALRSERALSADLGLRAAFGRAPRVELELVGFASEVRDLIVVLPVGFATLKAQNVGDARLAGGEASVAVREGPVRAIASYTRLYTEDRTSNASSSGQPLPGRPAHDLTFDLSCALGPFTLRYGFDVISSTNLDAAGTRTLPTRTFHGVGLRFDVPRGGPSIVAQIDDLFDQRTVDVVSETGGTMRYPTSDFLGYPLPGRRFTLAVRFAR